MCSPIQGMGSPIQGMGSPIQKAFSSIHRADTQVCPYILVALFIAIASCGTRSKPNFEFIPDMMDQPAVKAQERAPQMPVPGTIARGHKPYPYGKDDGELAGRELSNTLPRSKDILLAGQKAYNTYCIVCHGARGQGDGPIIPKFPRPPSLTSEKIVNWSDGRIFHVMTMGQNLMPPYASQVSRNDRWKIIHYIRALQRAEHPTPEDIQRLKQELALK